jgi:hypothetical protein
MLKLCMCLFYKMKTLKLFTPRIIACRGMFDFQKSIQ